MANKPVMTFALSTEAARASLQRNKAYEEEQNQFVRKLSEQVENLSKLNTDLRSRNKDRISRRFRCNRPGHIKRDCRAILGVGIQRKWRKPNQEKLVAVGFKERKPVQLLKAPSIIIQLLS